jgi:branched-chain amino acid transport system substrate-binding protein
MLSRREFLGVSLGVGASGALGIVGCGSSGSSGGGNEWVVGAYLSLSGAQAQFGKDTREGIELALEEINKDPPKGRKLKVLFEDDKSNATEANNKVLQLIDRDKVVALLGEVASSISQPCALVANSKKIPMISPSSTNPNVTETGPFAFRVCFIDDFQGQMGAEFIVKTLGKKKIGLLFATDDLYSSGLAKEFKKAVAALGAEIVLEKSFPKTETNFTTYLQEMKAKEPEIIYAPVYYTQMVPMARQAKAENIPGEKFVGGDGWSDEGLFKELEGAYFSDHYAPDIPWEKSKKFVAAYKAKYNHPPTSLAAMGYDAALVLADAMKRAKADTPEGIRDAIAATKDFEGATGKISIDDKRNAVKPAVIVQIKSGTTTYVSVVGPGADAMLGGAKPVIPSATADASAAPAASASASASPSASAAASASAAPSASASPSASAPKK